MEFSGVSKFIDTPVKRYSSGMYVRLAFAVAAHFEPEILIVDEVLAVGDAEFQRKCLGKMQSIGRTGRTVLFVSHNMNAIVNLTQRAVLLHAGQVIGIGPSRQIVDQYLDVGAESTSVWTVSRDTAGKLAFIESIRCLNDAGKPTPHFAANESITIEIQCCFREQIDAQVAFRLNSDRDGETIFTTAFSDQQNKRSNTFAPGTHVFRCKFPNHLLVPGSYHLLAAINNFKGPQFDLVEHALSFEVIEVGSLRQFDRRLGVITPCLAWEVHQIAPSNSDSDALS
jgi:lipopolysaccharide transport system ATP-binding protein